MKLQHGLLSGDVATRRDEETDSWDAKTSRVREAIADAGPRGMTRNELSTLLNMQEGPACLHLRTLERLGAIKRGESRRSDESGYLNQTFVLPEYEYKRPERSLMEWSP